MVLIIAQTIIDLLTTAIFLQYPLQLLTLKRDKPIYKVTLYMFYIITMVVSFLSRISEEVNSNPFKPIFLFSLLAFVFYFCFSNKASQKSIAYIMFIMSMCGTELIVMALFTFMGFDLANNKVANTVSGVVAILMLRLLLLFWKRIFNNKLGNKNYSSNMWQFDIIIFSQLMCSSTITMSIYKNTDFELSGSNIVLYLFVFLTIVSMVICDIALYKVLLVNSENHDLKEELELSKIKSTYEMEYYNKLKDNISETRKMNHDISNIITVVQSMIDDNKDSEKYIQATRIIDELSSTLRSNKIRIFCENELVNIIIINKYKSISENNIAFTANLTIPNNINIKDIDLCRIFTNIIDNAIESCIQSNISDKNFIVLSANIRDNNFIVKCENYCDKEVDLSDKKIKSTKDGHSGLGLEIISNIVETYSGYITTHYENNIFTTVALLKI